ncbi:MAG: tRNA guanosine(34) transglycosylase Tgt [Planctomycetes bacterium]|nr:tRNA guanosine(34) transglycosylase Tgt [Planctomycetota bacterium]
MNHAAPAFRYELLAEDASGARAGRFHTPHGAFDTPVFMPVATRAALKSLTSEQLEATGAEIVLANAYHLAQRPGHEVVAGLGGLHRMMGWRKPILTDSGGFQVFSLAARRKLDEDGVTFRSEIDGSEIRFTPERAIAIEEALGADIIMPLDHCIEFGASRDDIARAVDRTIAWARRSVTAKTRADQALFPIVQGGIHEDLRRSCAEALVELDAPGYACGGFLVGEPKETAWAVLRAANACLPRTKPRYVMGVGTPDDFLDAVAAGADMMDCVLPSRNARHSQALTRDGVVRLRNAKHALDDSPLDPNCRCYACRTTSRGYLRHLCHVGEATGATLLTIHNITYMLDLVHETRAAIRESRFDVYRAETKARLRAGSSPGAAAG